jgi:hypothetical protein
MMAILPLNHPEPFAATLGVMLYPGEDEADRKRARAFAAQYLAEPLRRFHEAGEALRYEELSSIASDSGARLDDLESRWWDATATGELFKTLFALFNTDPGLASWENAIRLAELTTARHRVPGSRSALWDARSRFLSVAHLWGAWCIREGRFASRPEVGYDGWHDFQFFLAEAEILREWGQTWLPSRAKAKPPLPAEVWHVPEDWAPPEHEPSWPQTGVIADVGVPPDLLEHLRRSGRPRKAR